MKDKFEEESPKDKQLNILTAIIIKGYEALLSRNKLSSDWLNPQVTEKNSQWVVVRFLCSECVKRSKSTGNFD